MWHLALEQVFTKWNAANLLNIGHHEKTVDGPYLRSLYDSSDGTIKTRKYSCDSEVALNGRTLTQSFIKYTPHRT